MSNSLPIRRLRHRIRLEQPIVTPTEGGAAQITWLPIATVWAEVVPLAGRELVAFDQRQGRLSHRVSLRYRSDITAAHRVVLGTRILDIRSVFTPDERRRYLVCLCEETSL